MRREPPVLDGLDAGIFAPQFKQRFVDLAERLGVGGAREEGHAAGAGGEGDLVVEDGIENVAPRHAGPRLQRLDGIVRERRGELFAQRMIVDRGDQFARLGDFDVGQRRVRQPFGGGLDGEQKQERHGVLAKKGLFVSTRRGGRWFRDNLLGHHPQHAPEPRALLQPARPG